MTILLLAAVIPPLYLLVRIYKMDKIEKEPVGLIVKLVLIGCFTVIPAALIEQFLISGLSGALAPETYLYLFIENFLCVALVEEGVKYIGLKAGSWKNKGFNYCFDGVIYAVAVSLGFAAAENIMYVNMYGLPVAAMRAVTAIPGHCIFGIFMGYYYGMAKYAKGHGFKAKSSYYRKLAIIIPMLLHGFYDFCASSGNELLVLVFYAYIIILDIFAIKSIRRFEKSDTEVDL